MKNNICLEVTCSQLNYKKVKIYYYFGEKGLLFNGCDNMSGSDSCNKCGEWHYNEAMQEFKKYVDSLNLNR